MVSGQELKMLDSVSGKMLMQLAFFNMLPSGEEDCLFFSFTSVCLTRLMAALM